MKTNLKDVKNFIQTLKDQLIKSKEKRKDLVDQLQKKESQGIDEAVLNEKIEECDRLARANVVQKNEMEAIVMKLIREIEERKKNEENISQSLKDKFEECYKLENEEG